MKKNLISEGFTYSLIIPAVFTLIIGGVMSAFFLIPGLIIVALGLYMFTATSGFELDPTGKRYRSYKQLFGINWGQWHSMAMVEQAEIWLSSESKTLRTLFPTGSPAYYSNTQSSLKSITYDLIFITSIDQKRLVFEFMSYKKALAALRMIDDQLQLPVRDRIAEKLAENQSRRQRR